ARVEKACKEIDKEIDRQDEDRDCECASEQDGIVAVDDAHEDKGADAGQEENVLDHDDAAKEKAELDRGDIEIRDERVPQRVTQDNDHAAGALGGGGADI